MFNKSIQSLIYWITHHLLLWNKMMENNVVVIVCRLYRCGILFGVCRRQTEQNEDIAFIIIDTLRSHCND